MSYFAIDELSLKLPNFHLERFSLELAQGKTLVLLGPSGAGKSVVLETVAGFYAPRTGSIELGGRNITRLPPEERGLGFMFQDYALFPHLTVEQNVAFGLRGRSNAARRTQELLEMVGARHLVGRSPATLSGGEKQRVALARALAIQPQLFLFDEPLSALDAKMREDLREDLRRLLRSLQTTSVYVTHDRIEALLLADVIAILQGGVIRQIGTPQELFTRPVDGWVAGFLGMEVLQPEHLQPIDNHRVRVRVGNVVLDALTYGDSAPRSARLVFRPEDVRLERLNGQLSTPSTGQFTALVEAIVPMGFFFRIDLNIGVEFSALLSRRDYQQLDIEAGDRVLARLDSSHVLVVPECNVRIADS